MKHLNEFITEMNHHKRDLNKYLEKLKIEELTNIPIDLEKDELLKRIAGYAIEEFIKIKIQNCNEDIKLIDTKFKLYYDFEFNGDKFEVKSFQKGNKYSNIILTKTQKKEKNNLIFILVEYKIENYQINITNIEIEKGKNLRIIKVGNNYKLLRNIKE